MYETKIAPASTRSGKHVSGDRLSISKEQAFLESLHQHMLNSNSNDITLSSILSRQESSAKNEANVNFLQTGMESRQSVDVHLDDCLKVPPLCDVEEAPTF